MAAPDKAAQAATGKTPAQQVQEGRSAQVEADAKIKKVKAIVYRGTVTTIKGEAGPGDEVELCPKELANLTRLGFFKADGAVDPEEVQDGTLRVVADQGANISVIG